MPHYNVMIRQMHIAISSPWVTFMAWMETKVIVIVCKCFLLFLPKIVANWQNCDNDSLTGISYAKWQMANALTWQILWGRFNPALFVKRLCERSGSPCCPSCAVIGFDEILHCPPQERRPAYQGPKVPVGQFLSHKVGIFLKIETSVNGKVVKCYLHTKA